MNDRTDEKNQYSFAVKWKVTNWNWQWFNIVCLLFTLVCFVDVVIGPLAITLGCPRKMQIHLTESLIELNLTGTLPDEIDAIARVSEFVETIPPVNVKHFPCSDRKSDRVAKS